MAVFAIMARERMPAIEAAILAKYAGNHFKLSDQNWFVVDKKTAKQVSESLGVQRGGVSGVVVIPVTASYYGVANSSLWDWLRSAFETADIGE
jgi:hypothetical protein